MAESDNLIKLLIVFTMLVPPIPFLVYNHYLNDIKVDERSSLESRANAIFFRRARWVVYFFIAIMWILTFTIAVIG